MTTALTTERHTALNAALADDHRRPARRDRPLRRRGLRLCRDRRHDRCLARTVKSRIHRGRLALRDRLADGWSCSVAELTRGRAPDRDRNRRRGGRLTPMPHSPRSARRTTTATTRSRGRARRRRSRRHRPRPGHRPDRFLRRLRGASRRSVAHSSRDGVSPATDPPGRPRLPAHPGAGRAPAAVGLAALVPAGGRGAFTRPLGVGLGDVRVAGDPDRDPLLGFCAGSSAAAPQPAAGAAADRNTEADRERSAGSPREPPGAARGFGRRGLGRPRTGARRLRGSFGGCRRALPPTVACGGDFGSADGLGAASSAPTSVGIAAAPSPGQIRARGPRPRRRPAMESGRASSPLLILSAIALVLGVALLVLQGPENEPS